VILGAHISAAAGLRHVLDEATRLKVDAIQFCTRNTTRWFTPPLEPEQVVGFRQRSSKFRRDSLFALANPLINLCSADETLVKRSLDALYDEVLRAEALGIAWVVVQPGRHDGQGDEWGIRQLIANVNKALERTKSFKCGLLLETAAGALHELGWQFEQLGRVRRKLDDAKRVGICLDTAKMFAAGYDLREAGSYRQVMAELERTLGLKHVRALHLCDSQFPLGSRNPGPTHIGEGEMGPDAFALVVNDVRLAQIPLILETPATPGPDAQAENLKRLSALVGRVSVI
jgi:deoxyribonuclease-4